MNGDDIVLARLRRDYPERIDYSLDRLCWVLERLGDPHRALPPVVHVAGTNGKGSTIAFLRAILQAAGRSVHVFTSPHLVRWAEQISVGGQPLGDHGFLALLDRIERDAGRALVSWFEATTAAAFLAFAETPADVVLLETGLGGRDDATNVLKTKAVTAVTRISRDHTLELGETLSEIAAHKAGIFRSGVAAVLAPQPDAVAMTVLTEAAKTLGAPLHPVVVECRHDEIEIETVHRRLVLPHPSLVGDHQIANAATAVCCADLLPGDVLAESAVAAGLVEATWPGRLQPLDRRAVPWPVPAMAEVWLDGGHNDSAGAALAIQADRWRHTADGRPLIVVLGMLARKRPEAFLAPLAPRVAKLIAIAIPGEPDCHAPATLAGVAAQLGVPVTGTADGLGQALADATTGGRPARILITGSLVLAGHVLARMRGLD